MTDLEINIEQVYLGFYTGVEMLWPKPTHFIISNETYKRLRKEYNQSAFYL